MYTTLTSPHNLRDTKLRDYLAEMREADRHVCRTCARFTGLGGCDRDTLRRLHLRLDDLGGSEAADYLIRAGFVLRKTALVRAAIERARTLRDFEGR